MNVNCNMNNIINCLYEIGLAGNTCSSTDEFITRVVAIMPTAVSLEKESGVRITYRDRVFTSPGFRTSDNIITRSLLIGGREEGCIEIHCPGGDSELNIEGRVAKTIVERISAAVRQLELELLFRDQCEQPKVIVQNQTTEMGNVPEKLIRSGRLAAVGELASCVGHELRNPLNVIRNCAYLLRIHLNDSADKEVLNVLETLNKQVDAANKIVIDLMDFTRVNPPSLQRTCLHSLVKESLTSVSIPDNINLKSHLNGSSPVVRTDTEQMSRVFINIITNACQAMKEKGELVIDTDSGDSLAWVSFSDTGCGIPKENTNKIFEPLFTTKPKGIGLGLAISKRLVEQNGGRIEVTSQAGKGTTFKVILPQETRRKA